MLESGEANPEAVSEATMHEIFGQQCQQDQNAGEAEDVDMEAGDDQQEEEDDAAMEALNLVPELPAHPGDGMDGVEDGAVPEIAVEQTGVPQAQVLEEQINDPDAFSDSEMLVQAPVTKPMELPGEAPMVSATSSSSTKPPEPTFGLNITPQQVREMIPFGCKIQHRRSKVDHHASGWQAWPPVESGLPSRFFSYGGGGRFNDSNEAMNAAVQYCYDSIA